MEDKYKGLTYGELWDLLDHCEHGSDEELEIYKRMVKLSEKEIAELEDGVDEDVVERPIGETIRCIPAFLDDYAGAMDNLSQIYAKRKEYAKALPLLEQALSVYRTMGISEPEYTYQRVYAMKLMIECLKELGKKNLAILYRYELLHLENDVLKVRENRREKGITLNGSLE